MPALAVRMKKNADGSAELTCAGADGSVTWQRQLGGYGAVLPFHVLTHDAVEPVLRHAQGRRA